VIGSGPHLLSHLMAQADVVVSPHPDCTGLSQQRCHLRGWPAGVKRIKSVAECHDLFHSTISQQRQGRPQGLHCIVDIRDDPNVHQRFYKVSR